MAFELAQRLEASHVQCVRMTASRPQHKANNPMDFAATFAAADGTQSLPLGEIHGPILVVDDLWRTGGTMAEVTRCLRNMSLQPDFGIAVAKTPQFHRKT